MNTNHKILYSYMDLLYHITITQMYYYNIDWYKNEESLTIVSRSTSSNWPLELAYWGWVIGKRKGDVASLRPNSWPIRNDLLTNS